MNTFYEWAEAKQTVQNKQPKNFYMCWNKRNKYFKKNKLQQQEFSFIDRFA